MANFEQSIVSGKAKMLNRLSMPDAKMLSVLNEPETARARYRNPRAAITPVTAEANKKAKILGALSRSNSSLKNLRAAGG